MYMWVFEVPKPARRAMTLPYGFNPPPPFSSLNSLLLLFFFSKKNHAPKRSLFFRTQIGTILRVVGNLMLQFIQWGAGVDDGMVNQPLSTTLRIL